MTRLGNFLWRQLAGLLPGELAGSDRHGLISPLRHSTLLTTRRTRMIVNRVRLFAFMFAVLTPLWIVIDIATLPYPLWAQLMGLRLLATAAFAALAYRHFAHSSLLQAYRSMAMLFAVPTLFYIISHTMMAQYPLQGISAAIATGYAFLPFVLLAGFAIFPLTVLESAVFAAPVLFAYGIAGFKHWLSNNWPSFTGEFWLLLLITGVAALASLSQLVLMMALVRQAVRDPLTGCYSRRSGEEILAIQFEQSARARTPLAIAFIDLDHFKQINDQYGHDAGDQVLRQMTGSLSAQLRGGDILTRWGGEEFLLILPNTNCEQTMLALARLYGNSLGQRPDGRALTASIGIAEHQADGCESWQQLVKLADERMYQAKQGGRDNVICPHPAIRTTACANCLQCLHKPAAACN